MHVRRLSLCGFILLLGLGLSAATGQDGKKRPVPPTEAQAKILKLIQELYADDLAKASDDRALKARLAQTLLQEGKDTADDAAGRYVLLKKAHDLAAEAGDVNTALQAAEELAQGFAIPAADLFQMRVKTLSTAAGATNAPPDAYQGVVDSALLLLEDTLTADDFSSSIALLQAADRAALKLRNVSLVASIRKRLDEVRTLQKEYARWEPFVQQLAKDPEDANANYQVGYYQSLIKGNWDKSVPMLARGTGLAADAANLEIKAARPSEAADRWVKFAGGVEGLARTHALLHAYQLHLKALGAADAEMRKSIEGHLVEINKALPAEYRAGEITSELRKIDSPSGPVYGAAFSPDGRKVIAGAYDGSLRLWDARTGKEWRRLDGHLGKVWTVAFHPDGRHVVSGGFDGSVRLWDLASAREVRRFPGHTDHVRSVCVSADGQHILSGGDDRLLRLWDIESGQEIRSFKGHDHFVWSVVLTPDGKRALSASLDKTVRLWDVDTGEPLKTLVGHRDTVLGVAFAPDGRHALSGSTDRTLILWDLESGKPVRTFTGHKGYVQSVAISPDGRFGLSGSADHTVRLWDLAAGTELRVLDGHRDQVWSVAFARDGRLALSSGQDNSVRVWGGPR
jgi:WD40 repeat protein